MGEGRDEMKTPKELEEAVRGYQNGDRESFNRIYELSYRYLYTCVSRVVRDEEAAMDMIQETYLEISRNIGQLNQTEDFLSWAAMIGNRKCFAYLKKKNRTVLIGAGEGEEESDYFENIADDECFIPETILQDQEKQRLLREIIDGLSDMQRLCVIGYYYNEEKQEQIAEELGIPVNTVKSHLNRAKANIKKGVLELEEKKGTRIYSLAPFMLLFFRKEMEECLFRPMPEGLRVQLQAKEAPSDAQNAHSAPEGGVPGSTAADNKAASRGSQTATGQTIASGSSVLGKLTGVSLRGKVLVGGAVAAGAITGVSAVALNQNRAEEEWAHIIEETEQEHQAAEETAAGETVASAGSGQEAAGAAGEAAGQEGAQTESTALESPEKGSLAYGALAISGQYDEMQDARDGLAIVCRDGKWGLVNYDDEVLVPLEYSYACYSPNDDGQTFFGNDGDYRVFDRDGNEIFQIDRKIKAVSDGVVLWQEEDPETFLNNFGYVNLDGTVVYEPVEEQTYEQSGAVGFNEGYAICTDYYSEQRISHSGERFPIFDARKEPIKAEMDRISAEIEASSNMQSSADSAFFDTGYPIGAVYQGYYVSRGMPFEDSNGDIDIYDAEGTEEWTFKIRELVEHVGLPWDEQLYWTVGSFRDNGLSCFSYGTTLCISLEYGGQKQYYLIDATKQEITVDEYGSRDFTVNDACILQTGDHMRMGESKYWLISRDGQWGFMDHNGAIAAMYDDACYFTNETAMVIQDGYASFIDENLETYGERVPARSVSTYGEIFVVTTPEGEQLCFDSRKPPVAEQISEAAGPSLAD